ncbi:MAG: helix-turn-helix transcriptional regulator [Clostridia bacterium]|nr:helix-turn-helix transcriptional regulator [Clostridia bacterium]
MTFSDRFNAFREKYCLSIDALSEKTGIEKNMLLKLESGEAAPSEDMEKTIFACINCQDSGSSCMPKPDYSMQHAWESYAAEISVEYRQSIEEGKDIEKNEDLFASVSKMQPEATRIKSPMSCMKL